MVSLGDNMTQTDSRLDARPGVLKLSQSTIRTHTPPNPETRPSRCLLSTTLRPEECSPR